MHEEDKRVVQMTLSVTFYIPLTPMIKILVYGLFSFILILTNFNKFIDYKYA